VVEDDSKTKVPVESFSERDRAALRFCATFEDAVVFVVSEDFGLEVVKRVGEDVVLWSGVNTGAMGLKYSH
jgi:hypothetical protein